MFPYPVHPACGQGRIDPDMPDFSELSGHLWHPKPPKNWFHIRSYWPHPNIKHTKWSQIYVNPHIQADFQHFSTNNSLSQHFFEAFAWGPRVLSDWRHEGSWPVAPGGCVTGTVVGLGSGFGQPDNISWILRPYVSTCIGLYNIIWYDMIYIWYDMIYDMI